MPEEVDIQSSMVSASWERSRAAGLTPEGDGIRLVHRDADSVHPTRLGVSTERVLDRAIKQFVGIHTALLVADANGFILSVRAGTTLVEEWLTDHGIDPGLCVHERLVATNALGATLEAGYPIALAERDHFLACQQAWIAAGAPIVDPGVRRIVGAAALLCPQGPYSPLLLAGARQLADDIADHLADETDDVDRAVIGEFVRARRERRVGILSIGQNVTVSDRVAQDLLEGVSHGALWARARELADSGQQGGGPLHAQVTARRCEVIRRSSGRPEAILLEVASSRTPTVRPNPQTAQTLFDGLVGRSKSWATVTSEATAMRESRSPALIMGEHGAGKASVAIAIATNRDDDASFIDVVDCAEVNVIGVPAWLRSVRASFDAEKAVVVLRHLDLLGDDVASALGAMLRLPTKARIVATLNSNAPLSEALSTLVLHLGVLKLEIPPLRKRVDDIEPLCVAMVARHSSFGYEPRMRSDTLAALTRYAWPGNVRELDTVVRGMLARRSLGLLRLEDLPLEIASALERISLTRMQQTEREVIATVLRDHQGNKVDSAAALGIARSTLYRKIKAYRLDVQQVY
jgi:transcriptional regulator of acetoin/glycerol metabolism